MLLVRRVLFPTDFSDSAEQAYVHAVHLAASYGAELHAVHVADDDAREQRSLIPGSLEDPAAQLELPSELRHGPLEAGKVIPREVKADSPAEGILEYARQHDIDVIVMGTLGRKGMERVLIGSVAEQVVREAPCPVLTVRASAGMQVRRVLVPVDFSEHSKEAIPIAVALAERYGAEIEFFSVIDEDELPASWAPVLGPVHVAPEEVEARIRKLMDDLVKEYRNGVAVTGSVRVGDPAEDILDYAADRADLIVMATHGRTGLQRMLLGSVAEKVIRKAECPVFTVRSFDRRSA
jgi:nucleotide-binding universal stress UspA family protein